MAIPNMFDAMNVAVRNAFSPSAGVCLFTPGDGITIPFNVQTIPLDPIRSEGPAPSNFTVRVGFKADFLAAGYLPASGANDRIQLEDGTKYMVEQVQADSGGEIRLILKKSNR